MPIESRGDEGVDSCEECGTNVWTGDVSIPTYCPEHRPKYASHGESFHQEQFEAHRDAWYRQRVIDNDR